MSTPLDELRAEESRLLDKLESRAERILREDPRICSHAIAMAKATSQMPKTYQAYINLREKLIAARMRPTVIR
jgi:hypothetical protein